MAIASLVLGILWIYGLGAILALVFGYMAKKQIRERGESGAAWPPRGSCSAGSASWAWSSSSVSSCSPPAATPALLAAIGGRPRPKSQVGPDVQAASSPEARIR